MRTVTIDQIRNAGNDDPHLALAVAVALLTLATDPRTGLDAGDVTRIASTLATEAGIVGADPAGPVGVVLVQGNHVEIEIPIQRIQSALASLR